MLGLDIRFPIIQAPMAGVSPPAMAAAVSNAGGLGSLGLGATDAAGAVKLIKDFRARSTGPLNVNVFVHQPPRIEPTVEADWIAAMRPIFDGFGAEPPATLRTVYSSFLDDDAMLEVLLQARPEVVSFHFGLPDHGRLAALRDRGCKLIATATNLKETLAAKALGIDAVVAQGIEAGGHRGMFDPAASDDQLSTMALTQLMVAEAGPPGVSGGGPLCRRGVAGALRPGAARAAPRAPAGPPPRRAPPARRPAGAGRAGGPHTVLTPAISGRPARCLANEFTRWAQTARQMPPDYPRAYDIGKALNAAAKAAGVGSYGAQWAGQGAPLARALPATEIVAALAAEL